MDTRPKTIICDIDGTLVEHNIPSVTASSFAQIKLLDGAIEKLLEWERKGYNIILLTGRKESMRKVTEQQLSSVGIFYDQLIMGVGGGERHLVNDIKPTGKLSAYAHNVERNVGVKGLEI